MPAGSATIPSPTAGFSGFRVSPFWGLVTVAALLALGIWAPSGLWLLAFLAVIIVVHEGGHWYFARRAGMRPTEFYWGFGPEIIGVDYGGCRYGLKTVFLGGYVKLWGMTPTSDLPEGLTEDDLYRSASHGGRLATILAGPFTNIATAIIAFTVANYMESGSLVWTSGVADTWSVIVGTSEALWTWVTSIGTYIGAVFDTSGETQVPVRFLSPVAQAELSGWAVSQGAVTILRWFAILSTAVGVVNLMPLPPLDGSHAAVTIAEKIRQVLQRNTTVTVNVARLEPLAYITLAGLTVLTIGALVLDLRLGV
ncbi:MAG: site-2 protease family protein [Acidimicrobiales bacterium]|nr:site-2 protease family protein [Acidimicrobiales bacterium]